MIKSGIKKIFSFWGYEIFNKKQFGNDIFRDFKTLLPTNKQITIFDIGANLGQTSKEFNANLKDCLIYAFEPDFNTYGELKSNTKEYKNIKSFNIGFGNAISKMEMYINKVSGGNSLLKISENIGNFATGGWTQNVGTQQVDITTLNSFCKEHNISKIDLLKIDTQGYELKIIEGASEVILPSFTSIIYIEVLFVELYKQQTYFHEIYDILIQKGYKLVGFYNKFNTIEKPNYLLWCDAVFIAV